MKTRHSRSIVVETETERELEECEILQSREETYMCVLLQCVS